MRFGSEPKVVLIAARVLTEHVFCSPLALDHEPRDGGLGRRQRRRAARIVEFWLKWFDGVIRFALEWEGQAVIGVADGAVEASPQVFTGIRTLARSRTTVGANLPVQHAGFR
jgi:hypothetical protein